MESMRSTNVWGILATVLSAAAIFAGSACSGNPQPNKSADFTAERSYDTLRDLAEDSEDIAIVRVERYVGGNAITDKIAIAEYEVRVLETVTGGMESQSRENIVYTSVQDDKHYPDLQEGSNYLLFLKPYDLGDGPTDRYVVVGDWAGMYEAREAGEFVKLAHDGETPETITLDSVRRASR